MFCRRENSTKVVGELFKIEDLFYVIFSLKKCQKLGGTRDPPCPPLIAPS